MPRQSRIIQPLISIPPQLTPELFIRILNEKIEEINNSFSSLDMLESELRGEEGFSPSLRNNLNLQGNRITGAGVSQSDNDYVTRGELRRNSLYSDSSGMLRTDRVIETTKNITTPKAQAPEQAPNLSQIEGMISGFVTGPPSSTDNAIARWNGATGRLLEDSTISSAIPNLIDNSGGTANDTIQSLPDPADSPATADALRDDLVANLIPALRNDIADLTAKINAILTALRVVFVIAT